MIKILKHHHFIKNGLINMFVPSFQCANQLQQQHYLQYMKQLESIKLSPKTSIFLDESDGKKTKNRVLTSQEKQILKLKIPVTSFNNRMTKKDQISYRSQICEHLYEQQQKSLKPQVRVLEMSQPQNKTLSMDSYVNLVYKDIFCRFLVSKGIGTQWSASSSSYGFLNKQNASRMEGKFYYWLLKLINKIQIFSKPALGFYSYRQRLYYNIKKIDIQTIHKIGQFITLPLTDFAKYKEEFKLAQQKGSKIDLLVFVEDCIKLVNPYALCIEKGIKMIILKHQETGNYLITSMEIFSQFRSYFDKQKYKKHQLFDSSHLIGMSSNNLEIKPEIQGYMRKNSLFLVDPISNLPDFERVQVYNMELKESYLDEVGNIQLGENLICNVRDEFYQEKIKQRFSEINWLDLNDTYQDKIFSYNNEKIHFKIGQKFQFSLPQSNYNVFQQLKQKGIVKESKIKIPYGYKFKKPRERRQHRKLIKEKKSQITNYLTLEESIHAFQSLPISTLTNTGMQIPLLYKNNEIIFYSDIVIEKIQNCRNQSGWDCDKIMDIFKGEIDEIKWINIIPRLLQAYRCLQGFDKNPDLHNVMIEPQSNTEDIIPYVFHLLCLVHRKEKRGRNIAKQVAGQNLFRFINLHPTVAESQREMPVHELVFGAVKSNKQNQYGYGFEGVRLWVCKNNTNLGDRQAKEKQINDEIKNGAMIRKLYWQIIPLLKHVDHYQYSDLTYLDKFMLDHINYYILNMEQCYSKLQLEKAYELTMQFFKNYVHEIYVKTIRKRIITYPNEQSNNGHIFVLHRIISLLGVLCPIFPFSTYHIAKKNYLKWPQVEKVKDQLIQGYNRMTKLRVQLKNKLILNNFSHSEMLIPDDPELINLSELDLKLFFDIERVITTEPSERKRRCKVVIKEEHPIGKAKELILYEYRDVCIRCSPKRYYAKTLCGKCVDYLEKVVQLQGKEAKGEEMIEKY